MKVSAERIDKKHVILEIEVEEARLEEAFEVAYKKVVKQVNVPGFRKGKVPRFVLEKKFGPEIFYEEALEYIVPRVYSEAIREQANEFEVVSQPEFEMVQVEKGKPLIFKAKVDIKPEVNLGEYKGLELTKEIIDITDEAVDKELQNLRSRHAKLITIEEGVVENGDTVTINFEGSIDGELFEGGTGENYPLVIGSGQFIPGFEEQLVGAKIGDVVEVNVNFPEDYHADGLAGKPALFKTTILEIKRKELASLDDEFAKDISEFDSLEELTQSTKKKLEEAATKGAESRLRYEAVKKATENAEFEIPQSMIDVRIDNMVDEFAQRLKYQGLSIEQYIQYTGQTKEDMRKEYTKEAEAAVGSDLVLEAIAKAEGIEVTEEELNEQITKLAEAYRQEESKVREMLSMQGQLDALKYSVKLEKAVDLIVENANIN